MEPESPMKLLQFSNASKVSPFAPIWNCTLAEGVIEDVDYQSLAQWLLERESEIQAASLVRGIEKVSVFDGNGPNSLSSNYSSFNPFAQNHPQAQRLSQRIFDKYCEFMLMTGVQRRRTWLHAWANIHHRYESIPAHVHNAGPYSFLSGHITLRCASTSTVYLDPMNALNQVIIHDSPNEVGKLSIFQQYIPHYTTPHASDEPRVALAFDLLLEEDFCRYPDSHPARTTALLFDTGLSSVKSAGF